jgi:putative oxidoreductase
MVQKTALESLMTDITTAHRPVELGSGEAAMSRLADRLAALAPPPLDLPPNSIMRPSPAVAAAMATSRAISKRAAERARRSRSVVGLLVDGFVAACSLVPYALVALGLRLLMARVFFFDGQTKITGQLLSFDLYNFNFSMVLPMQVKAETFGAFLAAYPPLAIPPVIAAYALTYAEFILPIMLVLGFATRFAALGLLIVTAMQFYLMPAGLWTAEAYWAGILLVLLSRGAGQLSIDHVIRLIARR